MLDPLIYGQVVETTIQTDLALDEAYAIDGVEIVGSSILHGQAEKIGYSDLPTLKAAVKILTKFVEKYGGRCLGVALPQLGMPYSGFAYRTGVGKSCRWQIVLNPSITIDTDQGTMEMKDGCLSLPGVSITTLRPRALKLRGLDANLRPLTPKWYYDEDAAVIAHEYDHLFGVLCTDRKAPESEPAAEPTEDPDAIVDPVF